MWSHLFSRRGDHPAIPAWRDLLRGRTVIIAAQTRGEVMRGLIQRDLGAARRSQITRQLDATPTVAATSAVADTYAAFAASVTRAGHALQDKVHTGDRWVAATAVHLAVPLLSNDGIFRNAPGLRLLDDEEIP